MQLDTLPKVVLHDHLDGGLRPATIIGLAAKQGRDLPAEDEIGLAKWFSQSESGSLESYLKSFVHTVGVMQTRSALRRVAHEAILDHSLAGVVYAELRFAPTLHTSAGLGGRSVVEAVLDGLALGRTETSVSSGLILVAMRDADDSVEVAELAVALREDGVTGFDLAGPERGFPADAHHDACRIALDGGVRLTIHAGEGDGPESIGMALDCGAQRLGHGVRIIEDCVISDGQITDLGPIATRVHSERVPLEICVTSNLHTGVCETAASHPVGLLHRAGFNVTINTDNRLMSTTDMVREFDTLAAFHHFDARDFSLVTERAMQAAFCAPGVQQRLLDNKIRPIYEELARERVSPSHSTTSDTT